MNALRQQLYTIFFIGHVIYHSNAIPKKTSSLAIISTVEWGMFTYRYFQFLFLLFLL